MLFLVLLSVGLSKICCTKLDLLQDIRKFYGELFNTHVFPEEAGRAEFNVAIPTYATVTYSVR